MSKYRVFISYSHQDLELVQQIVEILQENDSDDVRKLGFHDRSGKKAL